MPYAVKKLFQRQHLPVHRLKRLSTLMTVPVQKHVYVIHLIDYVICKVECAEKFETSFHVKIKLTLSWRRPLSYRNQSMNLLPKSMDWFLYDNGLRHERVNNSNVIVTFNHFSKRDDIKAYKTTKVIRKIDNINWSFIFIIKWRIQISLELYRSSHQSCSVRKGVLRNLAKFTGKHLCQNLLRMTALAGREQYTLCLRAIY